MEIKEGDVTHHGDVHVILGEGIHQVWNNDKGEEIGNAEFFIVSCMIYKHNLYVLNIITL